MRRPQLPLRFTLPVEQPTLRLYSIEVLSDYSVITLLKYSVDEFVLCLSHLSASPTHPMLP